MLAYFKAQWPDEPVPEDMPLWSHFEVRIETDVVVRMVEQFAGGQLYRNSIKLAEREGVDLRDSEHRSLVHGPFMAETTDGLIPSSAKEFERLWELAKDIPIELRWG